MAADRDYILGTHDEEAERLGLQHDVWRPRAQAAWERAGFARGQTIIDVGSGPGYASLDLAGLVGATGRVIAVDRSRRFLDALSARRRARLLDNITIVESDLDEATFDPGSADGAWCRWVLAFVQRPRDLLDRVARALKPGGVFVSHEYFDYATWRTLPRSPAFEEFVTAIITSWRQSGGEPDIGLDLPRWFDELGFDIESVSPIIDAITPRDRTWTWLTSFMDVGLRRLIELGAVDPARVPAIERAINDLATSATGRMITPGVLEVIARKR